MWTLACWDQLISPENLWRGWQEFSRPKRRRPDVAAFSLDADRHVHRIARELAAERWTPGPYRLLYITDPKRRLIAAARVEDRVVHHALHRLIAPRFVRGFVDHSYACLPGRGSHRAVLRFARCTTQFRRVLQLDVRRYFYEIDRSILTDLLFRRLREPPLQRLLTRILTSGAELYRSLEVARWLGWDAPAPQGIGLPIGNLTSQLWANVYLDELDHHVMRTLRPGPYQRYMDDIVLFGDDRDALLEARDRIGAWLSRERRLVLKEPDARPVRTDTEVEYLGYVIRRGQIRAGTKTRTRLPERLRAVAARGDAKGVRATISSYSAVWRFGP